MASSEQTDTVEQHHAAGVGALLKEARQRTGEELRDVSGVLKIRHVYLEAMEDGRFEDLPGATYTLGFVRAYAEHLGLDSGEIIRRYKAQEESANERTNLAFPEPIPETSIPGGAIIFIGVVVAVLAYGAWYLNTSEDGFFADLIAPLPERLAKVVAEDTTSPQPSGMAEKPAPQTPKAEDKPAEPMPDTAMAPDKPDAPAPDAATTEDKPDAPAPDTAMVEDKPADPAPEPHVDDTPAAPTPGTAMVEDKPAEPAPDIAATEDKPAEPAPDTAMVEDKPADPVPEPHVDDTPAAPATEPHVDDTPAAPEADATPAPEPAAQTASVTAEPSSAPATVKEAGRIIVRAKANSWIQVRDDNANELLLTRLLRAGDSYTVPGRSGLMLSTGNAGALEILVDGVAVPPIGAEGVVRRKVLLDADKLKAGTAASE